MAGEIAEGGAPAARVAFITSVALAERGGSLHSDLASVRREILLPAQALRSRGTGTHVISLAQWPLDEAAALARRCDRLVFGKLLQDPAADDGVPYRAHSAPYREFLSRVAPHAHAVFCFADDHFDDETFAGFYRDVAAASFAWVASSPALGERIAGLARGPVHVYPEPVETPRMEPRVPRRGLRERFGLWFARRARVGTAAWRLKLVWFGHPTNADTLIGVLPELRAFAARFPLRVECVTLPGSALDREVTPAAGFSDAEFQLTLSPWSKSALAAALEECDAVLLPQRHDDAKRAAKSNNRMVDALHAGRFVVAHPLPSYLALERHAWVGASISEGLDWLLRHPGEALRRLTAGQEFVAQNHSLDALAAFWQRTLAL